jgi:ribosomal protein S18 acetylase RimI-like enzyme
METVFTIKRITPFDEPFLWEMLYQALYVPAGESPLPREIIHEPEIKKYVENWGEPDDMGLIAIDGDTPVGAVWLRRFTDNNKGYGYFDDMTPELSIALLPTYRGKGIGSHLLKCIFEIARERYASISLSVSLGNPARRLYERAGFLLVKQEGNSVTMLKHLIGRPKENP